MNGEGDSYAISLGSEDLVSTNFSTNLSNPELLGAVQGREPGELPAFVEASHNHFTFFEDTGILHITLANMMPNVYQQVTELMVAKLMELGIDPMAFVGSMVVEPDMALLATIDTMLFEALGGMSRVLGATLVGEPVGQNSIFYGVNNLVAPEQAPHISLSHSGRVIPITNMLVSLEDNLGLVLPEGDTDQMSVLSGFTFYTLVPDHLVVQGIENWVHNVDPVLAYVAQLLADR